MRRTGFVLVLLAAVALLPACASSGSGSGGGRSDLITREEIQATNLTNAFDVVQRLRPQMLRSRGSFSVQNQDGGSPVVYVDGLRFGDLASLRNINAMDVLSIRYVSASDATTRFGTGHTGGVIEVRTAR